MQFIFSQIVIADALSSFLENYPTPSWTLYYFFLYILISENLFYYKFITSVFSSDEFSYEWYLK